MTHTSTGLPPTCLLPSSAPPLVPAPLEAATTTAGRAPSALPSLKRMRSLFQPDSEISAKRSATLSSRVSLGAVPLPSPTPLSSAPRSLLALSFPSPPASSSSSSPISLLATPVITGAAPFVCSRPTAAPTLSASSSSSSSKMATPTFSPPFLRRTELTTRLLGSSDEIPGGGGIQTPPRSAAIPQFFLGAGSPARALLDSPETSFSRRSSAAKAPPEAPKKAIPRERLSAFLLKILNIHETLTLTYKGTVYRLRPLGKEGNFKTGFTIEGELPLIPGIPNPSLIITTYRTDRIRSESTIKDYIQTAATHYHELEKQGFPTAKIFNIDTVETDGFFIVEKVTVFAPEEHWGKTSKLKELPSREQRYLLEIYDLFKQSLARKSSIPNDLQGNLGFNCEGRLVLFDFWEDKKYDEEHAFAIILRSQIEPFTCENPEIYQYLLSTILHSDLPSDTIQLFYQTCNRDPQQRMITYDADFNCRVLTRATDSATES